MSEGGRVLNETLDQATATSKIRVQQAEDKIRKAGPISSARLYSVAVKTAIKRLQNEVEDCPTGIEFNRGYTSAFEVMAKVVSELDTMIGE